jgi:hypothetical protein
MRDKINRGVRPNSSVSGAAMMLGIGMNTLQRWMPILEAISDYERTNSSIAREEAILSLESEILLMRLSALEQRKLNSKRGKKRNGV